MAANRVIGVDNKMPWHLSADLRNFKKITMGKPILMGRRTYESIGRPLPGRKNIIVSRNPDYRVENGYVYHSIDSALVSCAADHDEVMIIGGSSFYEAMLPKAGRLYLTQIHDDFEGDTFFPEFDADEWREIERLDITDDPAVHFDYSFIVLEHKNPDRSQWRSLPAAE